MEPDHSWSWLAGKQKEWLWNWHYEWRSVREYTRQDMRSWLRCGDKTIRIHLNAIDVPSKSYGNFSGNLSKCLWFFTTFSHWKWQTELSELLRRKYKIIMVLLFTILYSSFWILKWPRNKQHSVETQAQRRQKITWIMVTTTQCLLISVFTLQWFFITIYIWIYYLHSLRYRFIKAQNTEVIRN